MATFTEATNDGNIASDAEFRLICVMIHAMFATGLTQTADTGQINTATVTRPVGANTAAGYEIFRFSDTLQATAPVFMKIEMGSGAANTVFAVWFTIGTGSDGAGNITGIVQARTQVASASGVSSAATSFASAAAGRINFCAFSTTGSAFWFACERTKDTVGADTGTGLILAWGGASTLHQSRSVYFTGSNPVAETGIQCLLSTNTPSTFGSTTGIGVMIPLRSVPIQPGLNVAIVQAADFAVGAAISFSIYGSAHTFQIMSNVSTLRAGQNANDANVRLALRYE